MPFPSAPEDVAAVRTPLTPARHLSVQSAAPGIAAAPAGQQSAPIVAAAASILDEEMAKGVLAAWDAGRQPSHQGAPQANALLRQVHDVIDNIARVWPGMMGTPAQWPGGAATPAAHGDDEALPTLTPSTVLRPGQVGTVTMTLCNNEDRTVRLRPVATDLVSSTGGRISSCLFEFVPGEVHLEPGEQKDVQGRITVPADSAPGSYLGLWVVTGVAYLRALITIEVA
jgi:hypothetical protein